MSFFTFPSYMENPLSLLNRHHLTYLWLWKNINLISSAPWLIWPEKLLYKIIFSNTLNLIRNYIFWQFMTFSDFKSSMRSTSQHNRQSTWLRQKSLSRYTFSFFIFFLPCWLSLECNYYILRSQYYAEVGKLQFWRSRECWVPFPCYYSLVQFYSEWQY